MSLENVNIHSETSSDGIYFKDLILKIQEWYRFFLSKWLVIFGFVLLGGILGLVVSYFTKPTYTASTSFVLEDNSSSTGVSPLGNLGGLASMAGIDLGSGGGGIFQGDNIIELSRSRKMIEKTLLTKVKYNEKTQLLVDRYIEFNKLREEWGVKSELSKIKFNQSAYLPRLTRLKDSILSTIVNDINTHYLNVAKPDKKLSIFKVDVKSKDEFFAKTFNENIVKNVNDFYVQTKTKKSSDNVIILQQKTDSVRASMNGEIYKAAAVADATPNLNPTRQTQRIAPVQRSQFSAETNKAVLATLVQNLEMSKIALRKETPLIQVIDEPIFPLERDMLSKQKGIAIGGVLGAVLAIFVLAFKRMLNLII
ncbi:lipopolysaccharide biosynthesis protein [Pedobacter panaciterrae]|uniref:lipopolysaccharide biosynthesis protein n=1 Tax=Pedobacter panaciterrae TaxID=363849 RepID=UPI002599ACF7|nr:lipopolysaccharide biosynthesis protein [uncultured Pedobacter sp.]